MRRNKNKIVNRFDLGRVPVTSVEVAKPETLRELAIRLEREEREKREAPIRAAENQLTVTHRQRHAAKRAAWGTDLDKLKNADDDWFEANYADLDLPKADESQTTQTIQAAYKEWFDTLASRTGFVIDLEGSQRFQLFIQTQLHFGKVAVTVRSLQTMFDYLVNGDCFAGTELRYIAEPIAPTTVSEPEQVERKLTLNDVLQQGIDGSRDSDKRLRDAAEFDWLNEHRPMIDAFLNHLQTVWGFTPTDEQWKYIFGRQGLFVQKNWSHGDARNYDSARKVCARTGVFPPTMLTAGEVAEMAYARDNDWSKFNYQVHNLTRRGLYNRPRVEAGI